MAVLELHEGMCAKVVDHMLVITILIKFLLLLVVGHLFLIANIVTTSKALVTSSDALVPSSFLPPPTLDVARGIRSTDSTDGLTYYWLLYS